MFLIRTFLLWAVMLAVPFQGYAATTMAFCTSGQAGAASLPMPRSASMSGMDAVHDHGGHAQAAAGSPEAAHGHAHDTSPGSGSAHQCGICGACHAVALIAAVPILQAHGLPSTGIAEPIVAIAKVAPRIPDKPPRT